MIYGKWFPPGSAIPEARAVRQAVFVDELGLSSDWAQDDLDALSHTAVLYDAEKRPAATGRIYYFEDAFWIGSIAVLPDQRGQGLGDLMVRMLLDKALQHCARHVRLRTRKEAAGFFEPYGFAVFAEQGDTADMTVAAEGIRMGCAGHKG
ncbi:MAG TPA: GNAT family N-acetyltransferase [Clostridia bacterium]|nr:GNAT family N-acetyltransferase [Clostridia bacterium]